MKPSEAKFAFYSTSIILLMSSFCMDTHSLNTICQMLFSTNYYISLQQQFTCTNCRRVLSKLLNHPEVINKQKNDKLLHNMSVQTVHYSFVQLAVRQQICVVLYIKPICLCNGWQREYPKNLLISRGSF